MCKHIENAQVSVRAPCCKQWFDCAQCHNEAAKHELARRYELILGCKKCKKVFKIDVRDFEEQDQFCPRCDNHFLLEAAGPETEGEMAILQSDDPEALRQYGEVKLVDPRMRNR